MRCRYVSFRAACSRRAATGDSLLRSKHSYSPAMRVISGVVVTAIAVTYTGRPIAVAQDLARAQRHNKTRPISELKPGLTQTVDSALAARIDAQTKASAAKSALVQKRTLTTAEMASLRGRQSGSTPPTYRSPGMCGVAPWQQSFRNINVSTGNVFINATDIQVSPARGAGLVLTRSYNSNQGAAGPFGVGWTHAYDIHMAEEPAATTTRDDAQNNFSDRQDFFGGQQRYHRDADGLYTPPPYLHDMLESQYQSFLVNGPPISQSDTDKGLDGTVKHYVVQGGYRVCDTIADRFGNTTSLTYDNTRTTATGSYPLTVVTDPSGRTLNFTWVNYGTSAQPILRIVHVDGPECSVDYNYYTSTTDPNAADNLYNLKSVVIDPGSPAAGHLNRTTTYTYTNVVDAQGVAVHSLLNSITDAAGHTISYTYTVTFPDANGFTMPTPTGTVWASSVTEPAGVDSTGTARTLTWGITGILTGSSALPLMTAITNPISYTQMAVSDGLLRTVRLCRSLGAYGTDGAAGAVVMAVGYDSAYNQTDSYRYVSPPHTDSWTFGPPLYRHDVSTFGPFGNQLTHRIDGFQGNETYQYYGASQYFQKSSVTDITGHTTTFNVGSNDPNNPGIQGQVLSVTTPAGTFSYTYNQYGQKLTEVNANNVTTAFVYGDQWGNPTQTVQDPTPAVSDGKTHLNRTTSAVYSVSGRVTSSTDAMGHVKTVSYNSAGQPLSAGFPSTASTPAETVTYAYGSNGRMESVTDNRGTTTLSYEAACDRLHSITDPVTGAVSYTYGPLGERQTMSLPGGGTWHYDYATDTTNGLKITILPKFDPNAEALMPTRVTDDQGRRVDYALDQSGGMSVVVFNQTFDGSGTLTQYCETDYAMDMPASSTSPYYGLSHLQLTALQNVRHYKDSSNHPQVQTLVRNDYTYNPAGIRVSNQIRSQGLNADGTPVVDSNGNPVFTGRTEVYGYDNSNQLTNVDYGDGQTQSYSFDAMGNRLSKTDSGGGIGGTESYSYNSANMLLTRGVNTYTNDANGNTLTGGGRTNTWDSANRLVQCVNGSTTSTFTYAADGIRHRSVVNGTTTDFVLDASMFVRELRSGTAYATYLMGPRGPEYRRDDTSGSVRWYLYDGLGSVLGEVDPNGTITASRKYDVYGAIRSGDSGTSTHKFVGALGHPSEDNTGLIYMQARYMDPVTGRFVSEDRGHDGANWYVYCCNRPIQYVDPNGNTSNEQQWAIGCFALFWVFGCAFIGLALMAYGDAAIAATVSACNCATACFAASLLGLSFVTPISFGQTIGLTLTSYLSVNFYAMTKDVFIYVTGAKELSKSAELTAARTAIYACISYGAALIVASDLIDTGS